MYTKISNLSVCIHNYWCDDWKGFKNSHGFVLNSSRCANDSIWKCTLDKIIFEYILLAYGQVHEISHVLMQRSVAEWLFNLQATAEAPNIDKLPHYIID